MSKVLRIRPHHGACMQNYIGEGYSSEFCMAMQTLISDIKAGKVDSFILVDMPDLLCERCPNLSGKACVTEDKVKRIDCGYLQAVGISSGDTVTCGEYLAAIADVMQDEHRFKAICGDCEWFEICKAQRRKHE